MTRQKKWLLLLCLAGFLLSVHSQVEHLRQARQSSSSEEQEADPLTGRWCPANGAPLPILELQQDEEGNVTGSWTGAPEGRLSLRCELRAIRHGPESSTLHFRIGLSQCRFQLREGGNSGDLFANQRYVLRLVRQ